MNEPNHSRQRTGASPVAQDKSERQGGSLLTLMLVVGAKAVSASESESESKGWCVGFGHERLDVDRAAIADVGWADHFCEELKGHRNAKDQLQRAFHDESDDYVVGRKDTDTDADPEGRMQPAHRQPGASPNAASPHR